MRKFIISIIVSIVFLTVGSITLFVELSDFTIVDNTMNLENQNSKLYQFDASDEYVVIRGDENLFVDWQYDDSMKNHVEVIVSDFMNTKKYDNTLNIDVKSFSLKGFIKGGEYILEGLKDKEIRVDRHHLLSWGQIVIRCSQDTRNKIIIHN